MKRTIFLLLISGFGLLPNTQVFSQEQDNLDYRVGYGLVLEQR